MLIFLRLRKDINLKSYAYIVDGKTIGNIFKYKLTKEFQLVAMNCDAVLCCRMSPRQKAQVYTFCFIYFNLFFFFYLIFIFDYTNKLGCKIS